MEVQELKRQLEDKDLALTDVRLDALDKAREVDLLRETVHRLKVSSWARRSLTHDYRSEREQAAEAHAA